MSYRILVRENHSDSLRDEEYATVHAAVKAAVETCYGSTFLIVQVVEWVAEKV